MRKILFIMAVGLMCLTACAQREQGGMKNGMRGGRHGAGMQINKDADSAFKKKKTNLSNLPLKTQKQGRQWSTT